MWISKLHNDNITEYQFTTPTQVDQSNQRYYNALMRNSIK